MRHAPLPLPSITALRRLAQFDSQKASISLQSSKWASSLVTLAFPPNASSALVPPGGVDGWELDSVDLRLGTNRGNIEVSRASFTLSLRRVPSFYITRFIQPLCLLMTMAIVSVLFAHNPGRIAIPFTSFGAVISFLFVATNSNPVLPYSTRLDRFFLLCFYVAWIIFMFNVASFLFGDRLARFRADAAKRRPLRAAEPGGGDPSTAKAPADHAQQQLQSASSWVSCICSTGGYCRFEWARGRSVCMKTRQAWRLHAPVPLQSCARSPSVSTSLWQFYWR